MEMDAIVGNSSMAADINYFGL